MHQSQSSEVRRQRVGIAVGNEMATRLSVPATVSKCWHPYLKMEPPRLAGGCSLTEQDITAQLISVG
jgi:hypothetical protein